MLWGRLAAEPGLINRRSEGWNPSSSTRYGGMMEMADMHGVEPCGLICPSEFESRCPQSALTPEPSPFPLGAEGSGDTCLTPYVS